MITWQRVVMTALAIGAFYLAGTVLDGTTAATGLLVLAGGIGGAMLKQFGAPK